MLFYYFNILRRSIVASRIALVVKGAASIFTDIYNYRPSILFLFKKYPSEKFRNIYTSFMLKQRMLYFTVKLSQEKLNARIFRRSSTLYSIVMKTVNWKRYFPLAIFTFTLTLPAVSPVKGITPRAARFNKVSQNTQKYESFERVSLTFFFA